MSIQRYYYYENQMIALSRSTTFYIICQLIHRWVLISSQHQAFGFKY